MNAALIETIIIQTLRHGFTALGVSVGTNGVVSDSQLQIVAGAVMVVVSVAYHVYKNYQGKKRAGRA